MRLLRRLFWLLVRPDPTPWSYTRTWHISRDLTPDEERKVDEIFRGADRLFAMADDVFASVNRRRRR